MKKLMTQFAADERGQDLVEYGLLLGVISVAAIVTIKLIQDHVGQIFSDAETRIKAI